MYLLSDIEGEVGIGVAIGIEKVVARDGYRNRIRRRFTP